ncbi:MAG: ribonuclease G [Alphaproteobacteria bacterium HGW-Alphaproteobacteria-2]|nr:MAG: ribonuclease G [Alphaproteobacteria bacterium HGW-Alphaproteobacteria-2]
MKGRAVLCGQIAGRGAAALMVDGRLEDILFDPADAATAPGAIHAALAERPLKGQGGAILRLGGGARGFLRQGAGLRPGTRLLVQVATHAEPGKAVPVSDRLLFKGALAILTPGAPGVNLARSVRDADRRAALTELGSTAMAGAPPGWGLILRSAAENAADGALRAEIAALRAEAEALLAVASAEPACLRPASDAATGARIDWAAPPPGIFSHEPASFAAAGVAETLAELTAPCTPLAGNASLCVEATRALVACDVNTGPDTSPAAGLKANLAAITELPRQLRLRGLGGQIVVDPAPMPKKDRRTLEQALARALRSDPVETAFAGWTPLGHMELTRKRAREPLASVLAEVPAR